MFSELVQSSSADTLNFSPCKGRLKHIRCIDSALGSAGSHERMKLVNEQNNVLGPSDFVNNCLYSLFELPAIFRPGHHHRQVKHHNPLALEDFRHLLVDYLLAQALDNCGLADTCFAQQNRVVFRAPAEYLYQPLNLVLSADYRVKFIIGCQLRKVSAEAVKCRSLAFWLSACCRTHLHPKGGRAVINARP